MEKLTDNIKEGYFVKASEWWGLSKNPGSSAIFIYPDGKYIFKRIYHKNTEQPVEQTEGTLESEKLALLKKFIDENIKENSTQMIFDYGCSIEIIKDTTNIKVENNQNLFTEIKKLLPFND